MRRRTGLAITIFLTMMAAAAGVAGPRVELTMRDGRVWLVADEVTVGQVLAEWARVGGTRIVNGERVPGGRVTLRFDGIAEQEALDILLRTASGFIAVQRTVAAAAYDPGLSRFDRILILPTSAAPSEPVRVAAAQSVLPPAPPATFPVAPGVERIIGADGLPVPDDQEDTPQPLTSTPPTHAQPQPPHQPRRPPSPR